MFSVDGMEFNMPCSIERKANLTASEVSGMLLDKTYMNDIIGTFMQYTVKIAIPRGQEGAYSVLYDILSDPVDGHVWTFPYNQDVVEITGRVDTISDNYYKEENGVNVWRGTSFTVTANHPTKEMTLDEILERGLTPAPSVNSPQSGDTYIFGNNGWTMVASDPSNGNLLGFFNGTWDVVIDDPVEDDVVSYDGSEWNKATVTNLDEVKF